MASLLEAFGETSTLNKEDLLLQAIIKLLDFLSERTNDNEFVSKKLDILEKNMKPRLFAMQS